MNCKNCGSEISVGESFCAQCGANVESAQTNNAKTCPICETLNPPDTTQCVVCGEALPEATDDCTQNNQNRSQNTEQIFCMHCGTPNLASSRFCLNCGKNLSEKPIATPIHDTKPKKSYTPIIVSLVMVVIVSIAAIFIVFSDSLFVSDNDISSTTKETLESTKSPTQRPTAKPTKRPSPTPTASPTPRPTPSPTPTPMTGSSYYNYSDTEISFHCDHPLGGYSVSHTDSTFHRECLEFSDGGIIHLCGSDNGLHTPQSIADGFKKEYNYTGSPQSVVEDSYCYVRTTDGNTVNYCFYYIINGNTRGFEMNFPAEYEDLYMNYAMHMQETISF